MDKVHQDESGRALVIALVALAVGTLLVTGFIQYVSTSQLATRAARERTVSHYSADAGVEHAIWRLAHEEGFTHTVAISAPVVYTLTINGQTMVITVTTFLTTTSPPPGGLPVPWEHQDVGDVAATGAVTYTDGVFTVVGSGRDIWNLTDEFHYVYQPLDGDGEIVAQIVSQEHTNWWAKAGVMIRETLDADARHAFIAGTPDGSNRVTRSAFQWRTSTGGASHSTHDNSPDPSDPYWVRLVRSGDTFTGYWGTDGTGWTLVDTTTVVMTNTVYVGLAVTSHNDGTLCTVEFDDVSVTD